MTITTMPVDAQQSLPVLRTVQADLRVDTKSKVVRGVAILQRGPLNEGDSRQWSIDDESIEQVLSLASSFQKGLKARWTHPTMSNDGLGQYLGRWRNPRLSEDGGTILADLHLARVAFNGGQESRGQWVLDMAEDDPEAFGVSIAPLLDESAMADLEVEGERTPMRFTKLIAGDVVDQPAATRGGLFGGQLSIAKAPAVASQFLDTLFSDATPEVVRSRAAAFVDSYLANRPGGDALPQEPIMANEKTPAGNDDALASLTAGLQSLTATVEELAAKVNAEAEAASESDALSTERTRCSELIALSKNCGLSNADKLSTEWINKGTTLLEAKASLGDLAIAQNKLTSDPGAAADDPDAQLKAEYKSQLAIYESAGVSEADYIESCKQDAKQSQF